jgi:hypothetical protein
VPVSVVPFVVSTLSTQSVSRHHDDVAHQTSLRSRRTMMTSANSLRQREAGRLITNGRSLTARTMFHTGLPARAAPFMTVAVGSGDRIRRT